MAFRVAIQFVCSKKSTELRYLTDSELENLYIRRGMLTDNEREIMEQHVVVTARMLEKIPFIKKFKDVPRFASMHNSAPIWPAQLFPSTYFQTSL